MRCDRARRLFGACWDDELTQAERDWLEAHFRSCAGCRAEYDRFSRALEWTGALPRVEASADLVDRVLARTRHATAVPDVLAPSGVRWVPVAAAAAVLLAAAVLVLPHFARSRLESGPSRLASSRWSVAAAPAPRVKLPELRHADQTGQQGLSGQNVFDHSKDLDLVLDQVKVREGRVTRVGTWRRGAEGNPAIISF